MGIRNLSKEFLKSERKSLTEYSGKTIAIDMLTYVIKIYKKTSRIWIKKVIEWLQFLIDLNIDVICVFDGFNKPSEKNETMLKRVNNGIKSTLKLEEFKMDLKKLSNGDNEVCKKYNLICKEETYDFLTSSICKYKYYSLFPNSNEIENLKKLIKFVLNLQVLTSNGEGESLCASLVYEKKADTVLTEDSDIILYNIPYFLTKLSKDSVIEVKTKSFLENQNLSFEKFFIKSIMMGSDYCKSISFKPSLSLNVEQLENVLKENGIDLKRMKQIYTPDNRFTETIIDVEECKKLTLLYH